jgi:hypothetical protein
VQKESVSLVKRAFPFASTVRPDLGERPVAQRFPVFADTEEDGGSTPPAPTTPAMSRSLAPTRPAMNGIGGRTRGSIGRESV